MKVTFLSFLLCAQSLFSQNIHHWESVVYANDIWHYFVGTSNPGPTWNQPDINDENWKVGAGGIGYGDGDDNTTIETTPSVFLRKSFNLVDKSVLEAGVLHVDYDDAFVAYINGIEVARSGISGYPPVYNQMADQGHEAAMYSGGLPSEFIIGKQILQSVLRNGSNLLAIEVHNVTANSSDLTAVAFLSFGVSKHSFTYRSTPEWFNPPFVFSNSNLPIILIETEAGAEIVDEPKTKAHMKIVDNNGMNSITDIPNGYDGNIGIEIRGSFSAGFPQKSYGLETRDSLEENLNVKIFDMPKENDWILLANYNDKPFLRNAISFKLFKKMGHYAPRFRHCEVMINNEYKGLYLFTEKLKRDKNRINIAKLDQDDNAGDSITGGYVFKVDYYTNTDSWVGIQPDGKPGGAVHYVYHDPGADELSALQKLYLKNYVAAMESVLYSSTYDDPNAGYAKYLNVSSFVDYFIVSELSRNPDAYKKSCYLYKDRDSRGGLITSGPVWDFDWAYKNIPDGCNIFNQTDGSGWAYMVNSTSCNVNPNPAGWMLKLMEDPVFKNKVGNRYHQVRQTYMSNQAIHLFMDSIAEHCQMAQKRHYLKYPILGKNTGAPEIDAIPASFDGEVSKLRNWIDIRLAWLDENMPEATASKLPELKNEPNVRLFPNPADQYVFIESDRKIETVEIHALTGAMVWHKVINGYMSHVNLEELKSGIYLVKVVHINNMVWYSKIIVN